MKTAFAVLLAVHGTIHLIGFAKAFGLASIAQLKQPIGRPAGALWLLAGMAFITGAILLFVSPRDWWVAAVPALVLSQIVILGSWTDAKFGAIANLVILVPVMMSLVELRDSSYRAIYRREVERGLARHPPTPLITEADLFSLPPLVQTYLRRVGVVGRPRVHDFRARFRGEMRSKHDGGWMTIRAEQHNFLDEPSRIFLMEASLYGIPFEALHLYVGSSAIMRVRASSLLDIVDARGPEMNQSETVTLFNDMSLLAPASLLDANVQWREVDARTVLGTFTNAGNTISAELSFDAEGDLVGFLSNDRYQSADGKTYRKFPWWTPVSDYQDFGGLRLAARGEATWREPEGDFVYARFVLEEVQYNRRPLPAQGESTVPCDVQRLGIR